MIPVKLQLKNFLSYGSEVQEINFLPYHLICLSGSNGHGKSALLDAMTWAVWGQARKGSGATKPDQGLLRLGQRNMKVVFDFIFGNARYRVHREFTFAYGKPSTYLEFGLFGEGDKIVPLTGKTIRKTQQKIEELLGLDYDAFVNSAFIRQGNSGEFSHKSPKERKEVLGAILGLKQYEQLRKLAAEKARSQDAERQTNLRLQERLQRELSQKEELVEKKQSCEQELVSVEKQIEENNAALQKIILQQQQLKEQQKEYAQLQEQQRSVEQSHEQKFALLQECKDEWKHCLRQLLGTSSREEVQQHRASLKKRQEELQEKQRAFFHVQKELASAKEDVVKVVTTQKEKLAADLYSVRMQLQKVTLTGTNCQEQLQESKQALLHMEQRQKKIDDEVVLLQQEVLPYRQLQQLFDKRKEFYHRFVALGNTTTGQVQELKERSILLAEQDASCPLCEQTVSASRRRYLRNELAQQQGFYERRLQRIRRMLIDVKEQLVVDHEKLTQLQKKEQHYTVLLQQKKELLAGIEKEQQRKKELVQQLQEGERYKKQFVQQEKKLEKSIAHIDELPLCKEANQAVQEVEAKIAAIGYRDEVLEEINKKVVLIDKQYEHFASDDFHEKRAVLLQKISALVRELKELEVAKCTIIAHQGKCKQREEDVLQTRSELQEAEKKHKTFLQKKDTILQKLGEVTSQHAYLKKITKELQQIEQQLAQQEKEISEYKILAAAFGKDGIPALLIEEAIPEIEQEANYLLARLTDNQAQLFIESQRDLKKGGARETLDIKISDGAGVRAYELFSGGEAFRIDFALRIAISKLLARRAGTSLQTLIIDEGFGSQDEEGLGHIMDALYKIQDDFAKIIIVSHLPTMKDQFPVHFWVQKSPAGSRVTVIEQG